MSVHASGDRWVDWGVALALAAATEYQLRAWLAHLDVAEGPALVAVLYAVLAVSLAWRRSQPGVVLCVATGTFLSGTLLVVSHTGNGPVAVFIALILAFYSVGAHGQGRRELLVGVAALAAIAGLDFTRGVINPHGNASPGAWLVFGLALLLGRELAHRRRELTLLRERAAQLERTRDEQARVAVTEERSRIARELHDVVAHSVSVMVVLAQAGPRLLHETEQARDVFGSIESGGRQALVEMRRLLGILRTGDEQLAIGPQPGLESLPSLVEQLADAGLPVTIRFEGEPVRLPSGIDLSAYRIVQEALTNSLKHAGDAAAEVVVRYSAFALYLDISDNGRGAPAKLSNSGVGLIGMRERASLYGGEVEARTMPTGGYTVRARLPLAGGG